jgi:hypothetical protein
MEQVYLFFVANKDIKDAKKIDLFRIKTFVFFAPLRAIKSVKRGKLGILSGKFSGLCSQFLLLVVK